MLPSSAKICMLINTENNLRNRNFRRRFIEQRLKDVEKRYEERLSNISLMLRKAYVSSPSFSNSLFRKGTGFVNIHQ